MITAVAVIVLSLLQSPSDLQQGKQLFEGLCSRCHGFEGAGGEGPNLNRPLVRAQEDEALRVIIRDGLPDRGMPRVRRTTDNEQRQLIAYVRSLGRAKPAASTAIRQTTKTGFTSHPPGWRDKQQDRSRRTRKGDPCKRASGSCRIPFRPAGDRSCETNRADCSSLALES